MEGISVKPTSRYPVFAALVLLCAFNLQANDTLEIDKAFCGAKDSWRDVTMFLQDQINSGALSVSIAQPFSSIGGDPAPGRMKNLIIDYRVNGLPHRLWLEEQFPVAFRVELPSPDADVPSDNPQLTTMMENITSPANAHAQRLGHYGDVLVYVAVCMSFAALAGSGLALFQLRQIRRALTTRTIDVGSSGVPPRV